MTDQSKNPLYSLVTFGRNDNYNPDFLYRLQTMLNFNARALEKIGRLDSVEFVVVDWGSGTPLREVLALEASAVEATSFLEISPETAARESDGPNGINYAKALNTGVRRARGRFVGIQGADLLTTSASWRGLLASLEDPHADFPALSRFILLVPRHTVPWSFVARQPDLDRWERWLLTRSQATPPPARMVTSHPAVGGGMGILILHRDLWRDTKALEETFPGWGFSDNDLVLRVSAHHPWIDAGTYGVVCHKMAHAPHGLRGRFFSKTGSSIVRNPHWITTSLASRSADWGMSQVVLEAKKAVPSRRQSQAPLAAWAGDAALEDNGQGVGGCFAEDVSGHVKVALRGAKAAMYEASELEMLHVLSWFALRRLPMSYLEIGLSHHFYVRAISTACPSVDIFILEDEEKDRDDAMPRAIDICERLVWKWGHKGYLRTAAGDIHANFARLKSSFIGPFNFESVVLNLEKPGDVELLLPVLEAVVDGGMLAIHAAQPKLVEAGLRRCNSLSPKAHIVCGASGRTAFLLVNRNLTEVSQRQRSPAYRPARLRVPMRIGLRVHTAALRRRLRKLLRRRGSLK